MAPFSQKAIPKHNTDSSQDIQNSPTYPIQISQRNALLHIPTTGEILVVFQYTCSEVRALCQVPDPIRRTFRTSSTDKFDRL